MVGEVCIVFGCLVYVFFVGWKVECVKLCVVCVFELCELVD